MGLASALVAGVSRVFAWIGRVVVTPGAAADVDAGRDVVSARYDGTIAWH